MEASESQSEYSNFEAPGIVLYILSGGVGSSGEQLVRTVIAQFPNIDISIEIYQKVFTKNQVRQILDEASTNQAIVAHTFVDPKLRHSVAKYAQKMGLVEVDLVGPLMENLADISKQIPLGKPGLYRQLYKSYFDRIMAMDFGLDHDDGKNPKGWSKAEIILLGASRVGKTPISLYLSVLGWKAANVPLVAGIEPNQELFNLDIRRLIGLTISPSELIEHRKHRQRSLGVSGGNSDYVDPVKVYEEIESIEKYLRRKGISIIDVTNKPIETCSDEIIQTLKRKFKNLKYEKNLP